MFLLNPSIKLKLCISITSWLFDLKSTVVLNTKLQIHIVRSIFVGARHKVWEYSEWVAASQQSCRKKFYKCWCCVTFTVSNSELSGHCVCVAMFTAMVWSRLKFDWDLKIRPKLVSSALMAAIKRYSEKFSSWFEADFCGCEMSLYIKIITTLLIFPLVNCKIAALAQKKLTWRFQYWQCFWQWWLHLFFFNLTLYRKQMMDFCLLLFWLLFMSVVKSLQPQTVFWTSTSILQEQNSSAHIPTHQRGTARHRQSTPAGTLPHCRSASGFPLVRWRSRLRWWSRWWWRCLGAGSPSSPVLPSCPHAWVLSSLRKLCVHLLQFLCEQMQSFQSSLYTVPTTLLLFMNALSVTADTPCGWG